ncbi:2-oxo-4-hydroxy-4-carboxy-5-ureidoimidazoline decarboxylase [Nonomuraea turkmeniaca]|uniref:2-oxo-4-hydroxy-4-carboxy-5-ureidoimidazoline decarboxylase n=1 Tax=Nonomuraea turkmeniaca TaxID=103838 RepID=A0A5S4F6C5_9ACTN|nr:2-oxo-4-hydroxy-4-carboxy-5-ureidoimidazoline decarboxylase [Nonomuraea turkmeniaca]TMR11682.1 2-oxo-4-hydroxy-4-carboxy-5-ureidoimidazoline decarboxylase [Nonomuraea turkmeniaca]
MPDTLTALDAFNARSPAAAEDELLACCASRAFAADVASRRPYGDLAALLAAAEESVRGLAWPDVVEALAAHPRIGERAGGGGREAAWSRQEQAGVEEERREALAQGNREYEARFGHVYLVCATGLSGAQMLARLRERLGHDEESERSVVREELAKITRLRLVKLMEGER